MDGATYATTEVGVGVYLNGVQVGPTIVHRTLTVGDMIRWLNDGGIEDIVKLQANTEGGEK